MSERMQTHVIFHGAVVLLIGNLCGIPYGDAIGRSLADDVIRAWRVAHTGGVTGGLSLVALGAVLHRLTFGEAFLKVLVWSLLVGTYCITLGFLTAAVVGVRGINPEGPLLNSMVHVAYMAGALGVLACSVLFVFGAFPRVQRARPR
jgi:hypothetical protein